MLRKFLISAAAAIGFTAASFGGAQAVILGEASVTLFDGLYTNQNGVQSLGASFVYSNDLPDSNTLARYEASAFLTVEGQELFNESLDLGVTTLEDLIPPEVIEFGLLALDLLLNNPTGTIFIDETDPDINFDYTFALFPARTSLPALDSFS